MTTLTRKTTATPKANDLRPRWRLLDADGKVLGRLAVEIAHILKGKHKPNYSPHMLTGDFVIVVNAAKVRVTGRKAEQKIYYSHSLYPGGLKEVSYGRMMSRHPTRIIEHAVKGMLPHNRLGRQMLRRLKIYAGAEHPHESQVAGSLKEDAKDQEQGVTWIGLPKPQYKKRARKPAAPKPEPVAEAEVATPETVAEAETVVAEPVAQEPEAVTSEVETPEAVETSTAESEAPAPEATTADPEPEPADAPAEEAAPEQGEEEKSRGA